MNKNVWLGILWGGIIAGSLDIGVAALINSLNPLIILRAVASGVLGKAALAGGNEIPAIGMVLQWAMSVIIAAIYVGASLRLSILTRRWIPASLAFGVAVFVVMSYVVVPLSNAPFHANGTAYSFWMNLFAMLLYGLIVGFFAQRFVKHR